MFTVTVSEVISVLAYLKINFGFVKLEFGIF